MHNDRDRLDVITHSKYNTLHVTFTFTDISCGPLLKKEGIIKTPQAANYLDGAVVTFACKPDFYIHGDEVRHCINGTWSPGWWAWCRGIVVHTYSNEYSQ
jgi:hypothetical protein